MVSLVSGSRRRSSSAAAIGAAACAISLALCAASTAETSPSSPESAAADVALCAQSQPGVRCSHGNGRRTPGAGTTGKVSHAGWPAITGELLLVDDHGRRASGSPLNDELLGGHGSDTLIGRAGKDVLWGDQYPTGNNSWQRDTLWGGPGDDWIYPSHGTNRVHAGSGADIVRAYYGHGAIDCGAGRDTAQVRMNKSYTLRNCERVVHFCAWGSDASGRCRKPGEARTARDEA